MIFPPIHRTYEFNNHCTAKDNHNCELEFACHRCKIAHETYEKDLNENYREWVLPTQEKERCGVKYKINEAGTVAEFSNIIDLYNGFNSVKFLPLLDYNSFLMDQPELKQLYPHWYALKVLEKLGEPISYKGGRDMPLIVEYEDRAYLIAPMMEAE